MIGSRHCPEQTYVELIGRTIPHPTLVKNGMRGERFSDHEDLFGFKRYELSRVKIPAAQDLAGVCYDATALQ